MDLDGVVTILRSAAGDAMDEVPSMPIPSGTASVDCAVFGAAYMRDRMMESVDLSEFDELDETDLEDHKERVEKFCLSYCYYGRKAGEPGHHPRCGPCPLRPLVVDVIANQVALAMKGDSDEQG